MITFLYGQDGYRIKQRVDTLIVKATDVQRYDVAGNDDFVRFEQSIKTVGLFADAATSVVSGAFAQPKLLELLKHYKLETDKDRHVIITTQGAKTELQKADKELFAYLNSKKNTVETLAPLDDADLAKWLIKLAKQYDLALSAPLARMLIERVTDTDRTKKSANNDRTFRLAMEIEKIRNYKHANPKPQTSNPVSQDDIELLVAPVVNLNIFALTDAVAAKQRGQATKLLHQSLSDGMDPFFVQSMLIFQFRNMLKVKSMLDARIAPTAIATQAKIHPYVARKTVSVVSNFEMQELKNKFTDLQQLEIDTKQGRIDLEDGLYQFVFGLT